MIADGRVRKYSNAGYSAMGGGSQFVAQLDPDSTPDRAE